MRLTLHKWYAADEAIAAFGGTPASERLCDGQFVVLPGVVLCLFTLGKPMKEPECLSPTRFVWRPRRHDYEPTDTLPWLPEAVREVWDRTQNPVKKLREHQVFLRTPSDQGFFYAGPAHLGNYFCVPDTDITKLSAEFELAEKLSREIWLKFGGYAGWLLEINHNQHQIDADGLMDFERLIKELSEQGFSHLSMTRYEQDSLTLHTNIRRGWLMYLRDPADEGLYARDLEYQGDPQALEIFRCICGIDLEFPSKQTLPRESAIRAVVTFFQTGKPPECLRWNLEW